MLYAKVDRLAGKIYFVQKILKIMDSFSDMLTLENAGRQRNDTRSTFRVLLKTLEYNSNWLCGRSVASRLSGHKSYTFFCGRTRKSVKNGNFYSSACYLETKRDIGMGTKR